MQTFTLHAMCKAKVLCSLSNIPCALADCMCSHLLQVGCILSCACGKAAYAHKLAACAASHCNCKVKMHLLSWQGIGLGNLSLLGRSRLISVSSKSFGNSSMLQNDLHGRTGKSVAGI